MLNLLIQLEKDDSRPFFKRKLATGSEVAAPANNIPFTIPIALLSLVKSHAKPAFTL